MASLRRKTPAQTQAKKFINCSPNCNGKLLGLRKLDLRRLRAGQWNMYDSFVYNILLFLGIVNEGTKGKAIFKDVLQTLKELSF